MISIKDTKKIVRKIYNKLSSEQVQVMSEIILEGESFENESELISYISEIEVIRGHIENKKT